MLPFRGASLQEYLQESLVWTSCRYLDAPRRRSTGHWKPASSAEQANMQAADLLTTSAMPRRDGDSFLPPDEGDSATRRRSMD
jgi:hypothetical protein